MVRKKRACVKPVEDHYASPTALDTGQTPNPPTVATRRIAPPPLNGSSYTRMSGWRVSYNDVLAARGCAWWPAMIRHARSGVISIDFSVISNSCRARKVQLTGGLRSGWRHGIQKPAAVFRLISWRALESVGSSPQASWTSRSRCPGFFWNRGGARPCRRGSGRICRTSRVSASRLMKCVPSRITRRLSWCAFHLLRYRPRTT